MMGIDRFDPADLTRLLLQLACLHCSLHSKMSIIFAWIGTTPIRLAGIGFQHRCILPLCKSVLSSDNYISLLATRSSNTGAPGMARGKDTARLIFCERFFN